MDRIAVRVGVCPRCSSGAVLVAAGARGWPVLTCASCGHRKRITPKAEPPRAPWWAN